MNYVVLLSAVNYIFLIHMSMWWVNLARLSWELVACILTRFVAETITEIRFLRLQNTLQVRRLRWYVIHFVLYCYFYIIMRQTLSQHILPSRSV